MDNLSRCLCRKIDSMCSNLPSESIYCPCCSEIETLEKLQAREARNLLYTNNIELYHRD